MSSPINSPTSSSSASVTDSSSSTASSSTASSSTASSSTASSSTASSSTASSSTASSTIPVQILLNETITDPSGNFIVTNKQLLNSQGNVNTESTFTTTNPLINNQVTEELKQDTEIYNNSLDATTLSLVNTIKDYASQIQCSDFHGKGTIDDYKVLFQTASTIANESSQMALNIDISGFSEFGQAADDLSALFTGFITKLENVNIINDTVFLQTIANALHKIVNLSNVFGKFKKTIIATSTIRLPKSIVDTKQVLDNVMDELNCAMNYMTYFVNPADTSLTKAKLSDDDKSVITNAVQTITHWNELCDQGVSITMANDVNIKALVQTNTELKSKTNVLQSITSTLQAKLASYNLQ